MRDENIKSMEMQMWEAANADLGGTFHVTTTWRNVGGAWKVVFNMDQRVVEHE